MRLNAYLALATLGGGYMLLAGCGDKEEPQEADTDTDTDTDADTDSDTDTDTETGGTGGPSGPLGYVTYAGGGTVDTVAGTFTGVEIYGVREFNDQVNIEVDDYTARCEVEWDLISSGPAAVACPECTWAYALDISNGRETTAAGGCDAFFQDVPGLIAQTGTFEYGYDPEFEFTDPNDGTMSVFPVMMYYSAGNMEWSGVTDLVTWDDATGEFTYNWVQGVYYL